MQPAPQSLLTVDGLIDRRACQRLAESRLERDRHLPYYGQRLTLAIQVAEEEAKQEKLRRGLSPRDVAILDLQQAKAALEYRVDRYGHVAEERARIERQLAEARANSQTAAILTGRAA